MLVTVRIQPDSNGGFVGTVPGLPGCTEDGATRDQALARLKLAVESTLVTILGAGEPLPDLESAAPAPPEGEAFGIHINTGHIEALAAHQDGRWGDEFDA